MVNAFVYTATVIFGLLMVVWSRKTWLNPFIKFTFVGLFVFGLFISMGLLGYIVRV